MSKPLTVMFAVGVWATTSCFIPLGVAAANAQVQLSIQSGVQLSWLTNTNDTYHLQWSSNPVGTWIDLVVVAGNGTTKTYFDPVPSGTRLYQVLDIVPGTPPGSGNLVANGGFENGSGATATGWTVDTAAGGPVYAVRTNDSPHGGSFNFQVHLASTGAGPVVQFNQVIPVTGGTTYPFTFYANRLTGSTGDNDQWRILWNTGGDTGYQTFTPGNNVYGLISNSVTAPASATSATIYFHFAGAASQSQSANIDIDDVTFGNGVSSPGSPPVTNVQSVAVLPLAQISWPSTLGVQYFPESTTDLSVPWNTNFPVIVGDGTTKSFTSPMTNDAMFFHLRIPPVTVLPPSNLHQVLSGTSNTIAVAWTASASFGVTGYEVLYGDITGTTTNAISLGSVTSTVISGLTSGVTYFISVVTLTASDQSDPAAATIQAQVSNNNNGVVWSDEFNASVIDPSIWTYDVGNGVTGWGNGQFEYDSARHENSYTTNGNLVIEARRENWFGYQFTSARMMTQGRFAFKYGTLEARIKMPNTANGLWPAFWMMGNNASAIAWPGCGEVDIVEMGSKAGIDQGLQQRKMNSALHFSDASTNYANYVTWYDAPTDLSLDYHLYKMAWTPTAITFYLDDVAIGSMDITANYLSEFHQPMFPILNIAIGGYDPSYTGVYSPAGVTATFPARMYVDYIRVIDNGYTQVYYGDDSVEVGNFGVYTDTTPVHDSLSYGTGAEPGFEYGTNAALYLWNNMTAVTPTSTSEGANAWSFNIAGGTWFGMGAFLPNYRNMKNYSDGFLHFDVKTTGGAAMQVGIKSCRAGEFWLPLGTDQTSEFGFARDGQWHSLKIPLNRFANIDFQTMSQMFMISSIGNAPSAMNLSIDNVWWEPSGARPTPQNGDFGVYTETAAHQTAGSFALGVDGNFFVWENTMTPITQHPYEGSQDISLQSAAGWTGLAFTPNTKYNLSAFRYSNCRLEFAMKTSSTTPFLLGMKSGNIDGVGQKWITFQAGSDPYGFVRDGQWHVLSIPMSDFAPEVDLTAVSQFFEILSQSAAIANIELDDIHFTNGGTASAP